MLCGVFCRDRNGKLTPDEIQQALVQAGRPVCGLGTHGMFPFCSEAASLTVIVPFNNMLSLKVSRHLDGTRHEKHDKT